MAEDRPVAILTFVQPLARYSAQDREAIADLLAAIADEILKGEHQACAVHELALPGPAAAAP